MDRRQNSLESLHRLGELVSMMCMCVYTYFFHLHKKSCVLEEDSDGRQSHRGRARVIKSSPQQDSDVGRDRGRGALPWRAGHLQEVKVRGLRV